MTDAIELYIVLLGELGFYGETICAEVWEVFGEKFSPSTIYKVLKSYNVSCQDYRRGRGEKAKQAITSARVGVAARKPKPRSGKSREV